MASPSSPETDWSAELARLEAAFRHGLPVPPATEQRLRAALYHTLDHPGSLFRGRLTQQMARSHGLSSGVALHLAVAVEYFHTASLLIDDLPSMDNADYRRGVLCVHKVHGEGAAMLAALGLINRAYALFWRAVATVPPERQGPVIAYVERRLGVEGVLNSQSQDLHYSNLPSGLKSAQDVALGKIVSLLRLSLVLPVKLGKADPVEERCLERLAVFWGLSHQILDDLKRTSPTNGEAERHGARGATLHRPNLVLVLGAPAARQRLERLLGLGDRVLAKLLLRNPALAFLDEFRLRLHNELADVQPKQMAAAR